MYIVDIAVGDLRNMYQAGLAALQGHKSAEFCDACHFSFYNRTYTKLHTAPKILLEYSPESL